MTSRNKENPSTLKLEYTPEKVVAAVPRKRMRGFTRQSVDMVRKEIDEFSIWVQQAFDTMAGDDEDKRQRILAILKTKRPECLEQNLTSLECKELIDYEIKNKKRRGGSKTGQKKYENKKSKKMKLETVGRGAV